MYIVQLPSVGEDHKAIPCVTVAWEHDLPDVVAWLNENVGARNTEWFYPIQHQFAIVDPGLRMLFKLTWGGK